MKKRALILAMIAFIAATTSEPSINMVRAEETQTEENTGLTSELPIKTLTQKVIDENPYMAASDSNIHHDCYNTDSTDEVLPVDIYSEINVSYEKVNPNASPAVFFDSYGHSVVPLLGGLAIRDINADEAQTLGYFSPKQHDNGSYLIQSSYSFVDESNRIVCPTNDNRVLMLKATDEEGNVLPEFEKVLDIDIKAAAEAALGKTLDQNLLAEIADYFRPMREDALKSGLMNTKVLGVNIQTLRYQVPGGMLSNLVSQLKEMGQEDKYEQVLEEVPRVRKDFGEPPLVTPSSQIVGTQAVLNVVSGERYKMVTKESKKLLSGQFGQTVKPFDPEVQKKCIGDEKPITCRPADLIKPQLADIEKEMAQYKQQDEDVLSYALFPQVATEFFKYREAQQNKVDASAADTETKAYPV